MKNYIIGGGVAGLLYAFYNSDYEIIDENPLGQIGNKYILGPRILKKDEQVKQLLNDLQIPYLEKKIRIGYLERKDVFTTCSEDFKEKYSLIVRRHINIEPSFLSSGSNEIEIYYREDTDLYLLIFLEILKIIKAKNKLNSVNVKSINLQNSTIETFHRIFGAEILSFNHLVSTIPYNKTLQLCNNSNDLLPKPTNKSFIIADYSTQYDKALRHQFHYIYSINNLFTRKTYQKNYICYEVQSVNKNIEKGGVFDGNTILEIYEDLPIQIEKSYNFAYFEKIRLFGRFAQMNHSLKINELLKQIQ